MIATLLALIDPGDEVIVFEPFYENYGPDAHPVRRARRVFVPLRAAGLAVRPDELARRVQPAHPRDHREHAEQPDRARLHRATSWRRSRELCRESRRCSPSPTRSTSTSSTTARAHPDRHAARHGERTVTINGHPKTFSVTGWRVGWVDRAAGR